MTNEELEIALANLTDAVRDHATARGLLEIRVEANESVIAAQQSAMGDLADRILALEQA